MVTLLRRAVGWAVVFPLCLAFLPFVGWSARRSFWAAVRMDLSRTLGYEPKDTADAADYLAEIRRMVRKLAWAWCAAMVWGWVLGLAARGLGFDMEVCGMVGAVGFGYRWFFFGVAKGK